MPRLLAAWLLAAILGAGPIVAAAAEIAPGVVGDGVHDDTAGLQALLDAGGAHVRFPDPPVRLAIRRTLKIHSGQTLTLGRATVIRLLPKSDTVMITNDDHQKGNQEITLIGGVWDMDNERQSLCSYHQTHDWHGDYRPEAYLGVLMRFNRVAGLALRGLTLKNPSTYGTQLGNLQRFTIEDITFDYNQRRNNMDGIHVHGNSRLGTIRNLRGATNDDAVALNADDAGIFEMCRGPIEDVLVDGVSATDGYTAVRLLSAGSPIRRVTLQRLSGTYRYNLVSFTNHKVHPGSASTFEDIIIRNVSCAKSGQRMKSSSASPGASHLGLIWIDAPAAVSSLFIAGFSRTERNWPAENIVIEPGATVDSLRLHNIAVTNRTPGAINLLTNKGKIGNLLMNVASLRAEEGAKRGALVWNAGTIGQASLVSATVANAQPGIVQPAPNPSPNRTHLAPRDVPLSRGAR